MIEDLRRAWALLSERPRKPVRVDVIIDALHPLATVTTDQIKAMAAEHGLAVTIEYTQ